VREGIGGAPRLYVFATCEHLIEQRRSAPVAAEGLDAGEAVDGMTLPGSAATADQSP
jgi:hypothetical protein